MDLLRVEQQRQALESTVQQLRKSIKYWHTFEAEYEGLKEEIQETQSTVNAAKLTDISETYDGELVTKAVIRELAGLDKDSSRTGQQIIRDIERRQEYVQKNIDTIQRRFFDAEAKLEEFDFAATRDSSTGLPLTEIVEELDDDDNVISSRLSQPEKSQQELIESLRKAGLTGDDLSGESGGEAKELLKPAITKASPPITRSPSVTKRTTAPADVSMACGESSQDEVAGPSRPPIRKKSVSFTADTKASPEFIRFESEDGKKCVSFADKVAVAPAAALPDSRTVRFSPKNEEIPAQPLGPPPPQTGAQSVNAAASTDAQKDLRASFKPGDKVKTLGDDDEVVTEEVVLPENESADDAQMRREMLDYHLNEVGHIVAQMDLEDNDDYNDDDEDDDDDDTSSRFTGSTHPEDEDTPYTSGLSDEEDDDEYGRAKGKLVSDDYRKQMLEMQNRLIGNLGPTPDDEDVAEADEGLNPQDVRRLVVRDKRSSISSISSDSSEKKPGGGKKHVSFAEDLDLSVPESSGSKALPKPTESENAPPVSDIIGERTTAAASPLPPHQPNPPSSKPSRFKKTRPLPNPSTSDPDPTLSGAEADVSDFETPSGPPGRTLAETLIERAPTSKPGSAPSNTDASEAMAERRQLAAEYYRRRNEMIRVQGGFKIDRREEEELGEWMEEREGRVRKVSKFKAARLKR